MWEDRCDRRERDLEHGDDADAPHHGRHDHPAHRRRLDHQRRAEWVPGLGFGEQPRLHPGDLRVVRDARRAVLHVSGHGHPAAVPFDGQPVTRRPGAGGRE